ncbi:MAG: hypothetical protein IT372_03735 [Polyangiaceae bacterium]|nr:hypothetical protein [Polyangiaceae bacterium]
MKAIFEPQTILTVEPDGEYTLHAVTPTPNTCYSAGPAEAAPPPSVRLLPEVQPVILRIKHRGGRCLQVLKPVRHSLPNLKLGAAAGKTTLTVFAMVGDAIVGSSSLDVSQLGRIEVGGGKDRPIDTSDWYAWVDLMPGSTQSLHVKGVVTMGTPGYALRLAPAAPQGVNPRDLILDLHITALPGTWPQVVTAIPVSYERESGGGYASVLVRLPDGSGIPLEVDRVC